MDNYYNCYQLKRTDSDPPFCLHNDVLFIHIIDTKEHYVIVQGRGQNLDVTTVVQTKIAVRYICRYTLPVIFNK